MAGIGAVKQALEDVDSKERKGFGTIRYVDSVNGSDMNNGLARTRAFATIAAAVAKSAAGDTLICKGSFSEAVTVSLAGLRIIGDGTGPKECQWTADADAICLLITGNYVEVSNIYFRPPAYSADRGTCAIKLSAAQWANIHHCRFQGKTGSQAAIYSAASTSDNAHIHDNEFFYMNTATYGAGIVGADAGGSAYSGWVIEDNVFHSCVKAIDLPARCCVIKGNQIPVAGNKADSTLGTVTTLGIGLDGTASGCNVVTENMLGGTYDATLYKVGNATGAADIWAGNYSPGMTTTGTTCANPA